ncbi:bromodomain-containing protein 9-like [Sinocyclocheilus grahami]|uniref:bromodomain-containing protein 9-like n=1 Tax=Sinocyclocheilus grahami TaxID=75366 RepID=UPI0007ACB822|nr:PREDICTED: bromodomain-containing protein 9-like [Sinocyclocheilus grahami]
MGKKHKKHKPEWRKVEGDYEDKPLDKPLKLVLKVGGSEVTELSGSGHDSSYYDDRSDHEWERHKEKKKKKKKKSEKEKYVDDEDRRRRKEEKKKKRERAQSENACSAPVEPFTLPKPVEVLPEEKKRKRDKFESESEADEFHPGVKVEVEQQADRPVRACRTQQGTTIYLGLSCMGYLKKDSDGSLNYTVVNQDPEAEGMSITLFQCLLLYIVDYMYMGYLKKDSDGSLNYTVVNQDPEAEGMSITLYSGLYKRNMPIDDTKSSLCDMPGTDGSSIEAGSVLDFMSMKSYPDNPLDMLNTLRKCVKKEPEHEDGHQHFDDAAKLLQEFQDAAVDRVGSRPSSNLSSLSNTSERDPHHLGGSPHLADQTEMVEDPYEFLQSPEPGSTANS